MVKRRRHKGKRGGGVSVNDQASDNNPKKMKVDNKTTWKPIENQTPKDTFQSFISPTSIDDFFANYWEQKPMLLHRDQQLQDSSQLFSRQIFESLLKTNQHEILFGRDVNVVKYDRNKNERKDPVVQGKVNLAKFIKLLDVDRATMQIHQPQRFQDSLWHLQEQLESYFGCLVGSNVYTTPPNAQGLPPHHDDVEVFIVQLEGEKRWRLYPPKTKLASEYSGDFKTEDIGEPSMDFVLKPGDLLYFPRGTIHQAETSTTLSSHITISTYQHYSVGDYLLSVFPKMLEEASRNSVEFRRGLPINFISDSPNMKSALTVTIEDLLSKVKCTSNHVPDSMLEDFMASRLPPYGVDPLKLKETLPPGKPPNLSSEIRLKYPHHICVLVKDNDDHEDSTSNISNGVPPSSSEDTSDKMVYVYYSIMNDRRNHMMKGPSFDEDDANNDMQSANALKFPYRYLATISFLRSSSDRFVTVSDLPPCEGDDVETFLRALWSMHLIECKT